MLSQSSGLNTASLYASSAGPWRGFNVSFSSPSVGCSRGSTRNLTVLAPASSAFWISS